MNWLEKRLNAGDRRRRAALSLLCILNVCILSYQLEYVVDKVLKKFLGRIYVTTKDI